MSHKRRIAKNVWTVYRFALLDGYDVEMDSEEAKEVNLAMHEFERAQMKLRELYEKAEEQVRTTQREVERM